MAQVVWLQSFVAAAALTLGALAQAQAVGSLNGSASLARAFYEDTGVAFAQHHPRTGGVVAFNSTTDVQALADLGVVAQDWAQQFPEGAAPTTSTVLFIVRAGNPKNVHDWSDLVRDGVHVVLANPRTCNNGRYAYLGAWGSVREAGGTDASAAQFVGDLYRHAALVAASEREAVAAFAQRGEGDVLVAFESDAVALQQSLGEGDVALVYPKVSVVAENPVAVVQRGVPPEQLDRARAYLGYLYSDEAQEIAARHAIRPRSVAVLARHADRFGSLELFPVSKYFGSLQLAQKVHFSDGGLFDQLYREDPARLTAATHGRAPL